MKIIFLICFKVLSSYSTKFLVVSRLLQRFYCYYLILTLAEDKQFAVKRGLNPPSYGTAGDCYSAQGNCPQVRRTELDLKHIKVNTRGHKMRNL